MGRAGKFYLGDWINFYECGDSTESFIENIFADDPFGRMKFLRHNDYMDRSRLIDQSKRSEVDFPVLKTIDYSDWTIVVADNKIIVYDILYDTFIVDPETGMATRNPAYHLR